jgi:hypothetical protein
MGGAYGVLDMTALGRQEDWEEPKGRSAEVHGAVPNFAVAPTPAVLIVAGAAPCC